MIYPVLGAALIVATFAVLIAVILAFINGWDRFWGFLLYGFVSIAVLAAALGLISLGIKLISMGG